MKRITVLLFPLLLAAQAPAPDAQVKQKVEALLRQMTLEEKIGQLTQISGADWFPDVLKPEERVRRGQAASVLWVAEPAAINKFQHIAVEQSRLHIPLLIGLDVIHGYKTIFPMPLALAASWDPALVEKAQTVAAREARAAGINWTFAPMVDIARDARWGRIIEGAGEDPFLGAAMARAQVAGFQGRTPGGADRVLACAKHFAGYGAAYGGRDYESVFLSEDLLRNVYLPPFKAASDAGAGSFMSAYMDLNDVPATGNRFLMREVLRKEWGFGGFVISDAFAVRDLLTHGFARDKQDAAYRAIIAGLDMDMASNTYLNELAGLVKQGKVPETMLDESVRPVLAAKFRMGLFEHPYADESKIAGVLNAPEHRELARVAAERTAVLLRNEGNLLPLDAAAGKSIAVIGPLGDSQRDMMSSWTPASADAKEVVTIVQGIRTKLGAGAKVQYAQGVQILKRYLSFIDQFTGGKPPEPWSEAKAQEELTKAVDLARQSDVIVLAMGELYTMSGEVATQSTLELPGRQQQLMEAVAALGKPVVLVLVNGRPLNISWASEHIPAILEVWHPGTRAGDAVANLLFGAVNPGGKLPITWPRHVGQAPIFYAHNLTHAPEDVKGFTSRFWDAPSSPLYPFGYGLSYTKFAFTNLQVKPGMPVEVSVEVQNTGSRAGDSVVQLYIHQQAGLASRPVRELKGFERVALGAGEKKTIRFTLGKDELSYWNAAEKKWLLEEEKFDVWVGADSTAALHGNFALGQPR